MGAKYQGGKICLTFSHAAEMAATLGADNYEVSEYVGSTRVNVSVRATTDWARQDNLENNTMLKAVGND